MKTKPILIVEDEAEIAGILRDYLHAEGFSTEWLTRDDYVADWLDTHAPALMLLDMHGLTGLELCKLARNRSNLPVIMVTARRDELDRLPGTVQDADDYVCKPFNPSEVVKRIKAVLHRSGSQAKAIKPLTGACLKLNDSAWRAYLEGRDLELTAIEYQLLRILVSASGRLFTRSQLISEMYHDGRVVADRTIDSHIRKIRKKIEQVLPGFNPIQSMYGVGYRFVNNVQDA